MVWSKCDGERLATACRDHTAKLLHLRTGAELATLRGHSDRVVSVGFSPDGESLVTASSDARLWRASPHSDSFVFSPEKSTGTVRFSPDGRFLAQELWNLDRVVLWDQVERRPVRTGLSGRDATFSPDGRLLILVRDGQLVLHEMKGVLEGTAEMFSSLVPSSFLAVFLVRRC